MLVKVLILTIGLSLSQPCNIYNWVNWPPCDDCPCDYDVCQIWGDPHVWTFDKLRHSFQGTSGQYYRYVSPCQSNFSQVPFQVVARHDTCTWVTLASGITIPFTCVNELRVRLYDPWAGGSYLGDLVFQPSAVAPYVTLSSTGSLGGTSYGTRYNYGISGEYEFVTNNQWFVELRVWTGLLCNEGNYDDWYMRPFRPDFTIRVSSWNGWLNGIEIALNEYYQNAVCGLCGYYTGVGNIIDEFIYGPSTTSGPYCLQGNSNIPQDMWFYTAADWVEVNNFGNSWLDYGAGIRRLEEQSLLEDRTTLQEFNNEYGEQKVQQQTQDVINVLQNIPEYADAMDRDPNFAPRCAFETLLMENGCGDVVDCAEPLCNVQCPGLRC